MNFTNFYKKEAKCEETPSIEEIGEEDDIQIEEHPEQQSTFIPTFRMLTHGIKNLTMGLGSRDINGFKFNLGIGLAPNFFVIHEIEMSKPQQKQQGQMGMMGMMPQKNPFYTMNVQYHHGTFTEQLQKVDFSMVGRFTSEGRVDAIFSKTFGKYTFKFQSLFPNSNPQYNQTNLELSRKGVNTMQTLTYEKGMVEYTLMQKLGKKLLLGCELTYIKPYKSFNTGYSLRYMRNKRERYYVQFSEILNTMSFGSIFKLDQNTNFATELEFKGEGGLSSTSFGYRRKLKDMEVLSSFKSNGEIKSLCTLANQQLYKIKFFLAGNLFKEDFRSGYSFSLGQTE